MLDGSTDLSQHSNRYLVWKISGNKLCEFIDPWFVDRKTCVNFKVENNLVKISDKSAYQIETLTYDSLVVVEKIDGITFSDKIRKMSFVKTSTLMKDFADKETSDSIVITSRNVTPTLTKDIISEMQSVYLQKRYTHDFIAVGEIRVFPKKQNIEVVTDNQKQNKNNQISIDLFIATLEKSYRMWDLTGFEKFEKIIIPYVFKSKADGDYCNIAFFNKIPDKKTGEIVINVKDRSASAENFRKGMEATDKQKFDKAIEFFNKSHDYDNTNTDALYNIVSISLAQNNISSACLALKKLKDLEQTEGIKLFNEKCSEK